MSKENPSFQEKLQAIEAQSTQIDRAMGFASAIVEDTRNVIGKYFPKDILPTDASNEVRLVNLVDLGVQRRTFVGQTRDIAIPQLKRLKSEIASKLIAETAREAGNLIEGSYYTDGEEREIKELLLGVLSDQQDRPKIFPEIASETTTREVETDHKENLELDVAGSQVELEKTDKSVSPEKESPDEGKRGMENFQSTPIFPSQISALNKLMNNAPREEIIEAMGRTKGGVGRPFNRGTTSFSLTRALFKLRNRIVKNLATEEEVALWKIMSDASTISDEPNDISKNAFFLLQTRMGIERQKDKSTQRGRPSVGVVKSRKTRTTTRRQQISESQQFPRLFRKDELQSLAEILANIASKSKPLDPDQLAKRLFEDQLNSEEVSLKDALIKTKRLLASIQKLGGNKGFRVINYGTTKHPLYYATLESKSEKNESPEIQITPMITLMTEDPQEAEQPLIEKSNNPYKTPEEVAGEATISRGIYRALFEDYPSQNGLSNIEIAKIIYGDDIRDGKISLENATYAVADNGIALFARLKKRFGITIENVGIVKPGNKRPNVAAYRLPIIEVDSENNSDALTTTIEGVTVGEPEKTESATQPQGLHEQHTKTNEAQITESVTEIESATSALLTPMVAEANVSIPTLQEQKPQIRSCVFMPERKAIMVDGEMNFFPDTREAGRIMIIIRRISTDPTRPWLASEFIERGQNVVNVLENLRELKKFFTKNGFGEVLELDEDGSEAIISFKGKLRTKEPKRKK